MTVRRDGATMISWIKSCVIKAFMKMLGEENTHGEWTEEIK